MGTVDDPDIVVPGVSPSSESVEQKFPPVLPFPELDTLRDDNKQLREALEVSRVEIDELARKLAEQQTAAANLMLEVAKNANRIIALVDVIGLLVNRK